MGLFIKGEETEEEDVEEEVVVEGVAGSDNPNDGDDALAVVVALVESP